MALFKDLYGRYVETPDIVYNIREDVKIIRKQNGFEDTFPEYILFRRVNYIWRKRAITYCSMHSDIKSATEFLLWKETKTFTIEKLES